MEGLPEAVVARSLDVAAAQYLDLLIRVCIALLVPVLMTQA